MTNFVALLLNLLLAGLCLFHLGSSYFSKDKTKIWSPITFLSLTYIYYCVIPMFETDNNVLGYSSAPYVSLFHFAALLSFVSVLVGFYKIKWRLNVNKAKWNAALNEHNYKKVAIILFVFALMCYVPIRGFRLNFLASDSDLTEYDWDNQGLNYYFVGTVSLFVASCCLLIARIKKNKLLFGFLFWITLVTYIILGFRYRIIILVISLFTTYFLYDRSRKIRIIPIAFVAFSFFLLFNIMDISRSYSNGIRTEAIRSLESDDYLKKASETDRVYNFSALTIGRYHETGRLELFAPIVNAFFMPIPRVIFPWKPKAEYLYKSSLFVMRGEVGSAYLNFVEAFMAFSWLGVIINGLFIGWLSRRFWDYYKRYPDSMTAVLSLALFNGFTYVIVSRGYLAQQYSTFIFFVCLPFVMARIIKKFKHG